MSFSSIALLPINNYYCYYYDYYQALEPTPNVDVAGQAKLEADSSGFDDTAKQYMFGDFGGRFIPETLVAAHEVIPNKFPKCVINGS